MLTKAQQHKVKKLRELMKQVQDPFAVATATAQEMGHEDFSEGSEGQAKRDEIAESIKRTEKSRNPEAMLAGLQATMKRLEK